MSLIAVGRGKEISGALKALLADVFLLYLKTTREGKRAQQNRIHDTENRRIRTYTQSQRKNCHDSKPVTLQKEPQSVPHILK